MSTNRNTSAKNAPRKGLSQAAELGVKTKGRRVCALCWGLERDGRWKEGQIAHIDRDRTNNQENNLAWLCLFHHNRYDTRMNQSKNFEPNELRFYKKEVEHEVAAGRLPSYDRSGAGLLDVEVLRTCVLQMANAKCDGPKLEIWITTANQGSLPCGFRGVDVTWNESTILPLKTTLVSLKTGERPTPYQRRDLHFDAEYLQLASFQTVGAGQIRWWALGFDMKGTALEDFAWHSLREEDGFKSLDPPLHLFIRPVTGPTIEAEIKKVELFDGDLSRSGIPNVGLAAPRPSSAP